RPSFDSLSKYGVMLPGAPILHSLDYPDKDRRIAHEPDPLLVGPASRVIEEDEKVYAEAAAAPGHANLDIPA
ncbi:hypothetical protein ACLBS5_11350, partial [Pseudomonas aeruginosa]